MSRSQRRNILASSDHIRNHQLHIIHIFLPQKRRKCVIVTQSDHTSAPLMIFLVVGKLCLQSREFGKILTTIRQCPYHPYLPSMVAFRLRNQTYYFYAIMPIYLLSYLPSSVAKTPLRHAPGGGKAPTRRGWATPQAGHAKVIRVTRTLCTTCHIVKSYPPSAVLTYRANRLSYGRLTCGWLTITLWRH